MSAEAVPDTTLELVERLLAEFHVTRLRFHLQVDRPTRLPAFTGSLFRGLLGWGLKDLTCAFPPETRCDECHLRTSCVYPALFEPVLSTVTTQSVDHDALAPPFALGDLPNGATSLPPRGAVSFGVSLFGSGALHAPAFARALVAASSRRRPLGITGSTFRVERVDVATGGDAWEPFRPDTAPPLARIALPVARLTPSMDAGGTDTVSVEFVTPLRLKTANHVVRWPEFGVLVDRLVDRAARLLSTYHGYTWGAHRRAFSAAAHTVRLVDGDSVHRRTVRRFSNYQQAAIDLPGVQGVATYEGPVQAYLPLLRLGEFIHVGKNTTAGFGRIRVHS